MSQAKATGASANGDIHNPCINVGRAGPNHTDRVIRQLFMGRDHFLTFSPGSAFATYSEMSALQARRAGYELGPPCSARACVEPSPTQRDR